MPELATSPHTERSVATPTSIEQRDASRDASRRHSHPDAPMQVRAADLEPYVGLKYLSRLFKLMAVVLILLMLSEVITGLVSSGMDALPTLLGEVSRLIVFAGLLWGSGDLAILFIDIGHDLRAARILMGRQLAHHIDEQHAQVDPAVAASPTPAREPAPGQRPPV